MRIDAIIIGGGPAGSTAAIVLAQAGWSVVLVEKREFPRRKVCGECVAASNLGLLDALGIGGEFEKLAGADLRKVALMSGDRTIYSDLPANTSGPHPWGRALGREHLDTLLLARAMELGVTVLQPWSVRSITEMGGHFFCTVATSETREQRSLEASVVIGAYGSWEAAPIQGSAQPRPPSLPGDLFAFKANFEHVQLASGVLPILALPGGYGGMVIADHGIMTLACCIRRDMLGFWRRRTAGCSASEAVEAWLKTHCRGAREALQDATCVQPWLSVGPIRPGIRIRSDSRGIFLIGNAAGEAHPIIGEGISMAMQSAWMVCARLIAKRAAKSLSEPAYRDTHSEYARAWRRSFGPRIRWAAAFAHLAMRPHLTSGLLPLLQRWPQLATGAARISGKVRCAVDVKHPLSDYGV